MPLRRNRSRTALRFQSLLRRGEGSSLDLRLHDAIGPGIPVTAAFAVRNDIAASRSRCSELDLEAEPAVVAVALAGEAEGGADVDRGRDAAGL